MPVLNPIPRPELRAARLAAGITARAAGDLIGRTESTYAKIERGEVRLTRALAEILAPAYGVAVDSILPPDRG